MERIVMIQNALEIPACELPKSALNHLNPLHTKKPVHMRHKYLGWAKYHISRLDPKVALQEDLARQDGLPRQDTPPRQEALAMCCTNGT